MIWILWFIAQGFSFVSTIGIGDSTLSLRLQGANLLWVGGAAHFYGVDINNPSSPILLDSISSGAIVDLAPSGTDVMVGASVDSGMQVWYVWNPSQIQSAYTSGDSATSVDVLGSVAYVGTASALEIWDVTNPFGPTMMGTWSGGLADLRVWGDFLYGVDGTDTFRILNVTNPTSVVEVGQGLLGSPANRVELDSINLVAFVGTNNGIEIWDVNTPTSPMRLASCVLSAPVQALRYRTPSYLFGVLAGSGIVVLDVTTPSQCRQVGFLAGSFSGVDVGPFSLNGADVYTSGNLTQIWHFLPVSVFEESPNHAVTPWIRLQGRRLYARRSVWIQDVSGRVRRLKAGVYRLLPGVYVVRPQGFNTSHKIWVP